ncbi:hypothetical protein RIF29_25198 [Crotalaria pallida]|uniref:Uncharacterized protein n=1 Tax=Crotalaria pallida TaxID=3830 RepID=A0AAN9EL53_CROPI
MAKKRGRPPKHAISSPTTETHDTRTTKIPYKEPVSLDCEVLDEIEAKLYSLSSQQRLSVFQKLDALRSKIAGMPPQANENEEIRIFDDNKRQSVWDTFDISKLRHAGDKLNFVECLLWR